MQMWQATFNMSDVILVYILSLMLGLGECGCVCGCERPPVGLQTCAVDSKKKKKLTE